MILHSLTELFFPQLCAACSQITREGEGVICASCLHELPLTNHFTQANNEVFNRFYGRLPISWAGAFCYYHKKGIMQEIIQKLKYQGVEKIGVLLAHYAVLELKKAATLPAITDVVPVPLHVKKQRQRGFNQVTSFAQTVAEEFGLAFSPEILKRTKYNDTQTKKNLFARTSLQDSLFVAPDKTISGRHFLLVDDVITSGATLEACGRALLDIPSSKISILCMAMST